MTKNELTRLVRAAMFSALAIGLGYALLMIPNVELMTLIIFISGIMLGVKWGMLVGAFSEAIFSIANPFGSGLIFPPLLIAQITGMMMVGLSGGILRRVFFQSVYTPFKIGLAGFFGFILTFIFDSLTTLSYPVSAGFDTVQTWGLYLSGIGFTLLHQISNVFVFSIGLPLIMKFLVKESFTQNEYSVGLEE